jgi:hypothetical protein
MKYQPPDSVWDGLPTPLKWVVGISAILYFGAGLAAPFFW